MLIRSAEDGVAHVLRRHLNGLNSPGTSGMESEGAAQLGLFTTPKFSEPSVEYVPDKPFNIGCPKCPGRVVHQEGCLRCLDCGYTKCE